MLPSHRFAILAACLTVGSSFGSLQAQQAPPPEFRITNVAESFVESPSFTGSKYDKKVRNTGKWLEVEVTFEWTSRDPALLYLDDVVVNYYVLLQKGSATEESPQGVLLTGSVTHEHVKQDKGLVSVMYVAPRPLERLFYGKLPVNVRQTVAGVGATISHGGEVVAEETGSGRGTWWTEMKGQEGVLVDKSKTPFAALSWDYHEPVKTDK